MAAFSTPVGRNRSLLCAVCQKCEPRRCQSATSSGLSAACASRQSRQRSEPTTESGASSRLPQARQRTICFLGTGSDGEATVTRYAQTVDVAPYIRPGQPRHEEREGAWRACESERWRSAASLGKVAEPGGGLMALEGVLSSESAVGNGEGRLARVAVVLPCLLGAHGRDSRACLPAMYQAF